MADENTGEPCAKRIKVEDKAVAAALPEPNTAVQSPVKEPRPTTPNDQSDTTTQQDLSNVTLPSPTVQTPPEKPKVIQIDPRGDVEIRVQHPIGKKETIFVVCSRTLARVSPLWESSLFSSESEHHRQLFLPVSMDRQRTNVFKVILHILHHNTSKIPTCLRPSDLLLFLTLGKTYQITSPLSIWGTRFFNSAPALYPGTRSANDLVYRMRCANNLGLSDKFHEFMRDVALKMRLDSERNFGYECGGRVVNIRTLDLQDEDCIALLDKLRANAISAQLNSLKATTDGLVSARTIEALPRSGCQVCNYKWIGCIIQHLSAPYPCASNPTIQTSPLWPIPEVDGYLWAVEDLRGHIQTVQNMLDSLEQCRGHKIEQSDQGRVTNGRGGRLGGPRDSGRVVTVPCVPPTLLLPSPVESFEVEIKKLKTWYEREYKS